MVGSVAAENQILAGLPEPELDRMVDLLEPVDAALREPVYEPGQPIEHLYFPVGAVFSLVAGREGTRVEVSTIGREGVVGLPVFLGARLSAHHAFCQVPGAALRMESAAMVEFLTTSDGALHERLHRYTQAVIVQLAQSVACNQLHRAEQRAARWLLMTRDRVAADTFPLTQEFLAQMLGTRRATVSEVAQRLQDAGLITYRRGVITIRDAAGLEATSCACYRLVTDEYSRLL